MRHTILDIKLGAMTTAYFALTFANADFIMKFIVFLITVAYTIRRWYLLEKNKKE